MEGSSSANGDVPALDAQPGERKELYYANISIQVSPSRNFRERELMSWIRITAIVRSGTLPSTCLAFGPLVRLASYTDDAPRFAAKLLALQSLSLRPSSSTAMPRRR
jgi:hypothetical protein